MEIVSALRNAVAGKVGKERFKLWFGTSARFEWDDRRLTVVVPNRFFQQWIRSNFSRHLNDALEETVGGGCGFQLRVDPALEKTRSATGHEPSGNGADKVARTSTAGIEQPPAESQPSGGPPADNTRRRFADLASFVTGGCNRLAYAAAESIAEKPGELSPLVIYGPTAVGKTHLLEGIWKAVRARRPRMAAIYLSAERFTTDFLQALRGSGLPSFRRKYRGVELLLLDDLQFVCGKRCTQIELLYTVDALLREGRQLAFASDRPPGELADLGPELITRLESGMVCRVDPPDYQTRLGILAHMAGRLNVRVPEEVRRYVASHLTGHARALSGALCRLQAASRAMDRSITLTMAEEALAEMIRSNRRPVRLPDVEKAMCRAFGLEPKTLQSKGKAKSESHPRMLAMWLARKYTRSALSEISRYFGRRSHSTVISAQKRVDRWLADGKSLELSDRAWNVSDAVRQVERCLKAG
jgi:chromosomal replication initiator protein